MKIVFDTNVYLAAAKENSYASVQLKKCRPNSGTELYISPAIILEVQNKLIQKFGYSTEDSARFIEMILTFAHLVHPKDRVHGVLEDTDDHIILECALEAEADVIFSADRGLLKLKEYQSIKIAHPTMLQWWL
jgi:putative PIN family toxin of toxin-antitoxin system